MPYVLSVTSVIALATIVPRHFYTEEAGIKEVIAIGEGVRCNAFFSAFRGHALMSVSAL